MNTEYAEILRNLGFLEGAGPDVVEQLAGGAVERTFQPGEIILEEGSTGQQMYLIVDGAVEVVKGRGAEEMSLGRRLGGEMFGEMAFLEERPRFATIRAVEPTTLLELSEDRVRAALAQQPELLYRTVRMLSARLRSADLQMIADLERKNEELARAYRELKEAQAALVEKERLEREMELAREIQQNILPRTFPQVPGLSCAVRNRAARHVGGDFYDVIPLDGGRIGLVMADVSGKGMPAALFMALTRSLIRAEAQRTESPRDALLRVNHLLLEMSRASMFVTVFYGVLDPARHSLCYARAGHDYPLLFNPGTGESRFLTGQGMVLGFMPQVDLEEARVDFDPGDVIALYTDGITEANSPAGEFFGAERLREALCLVGSQCVQNACDAIFDRVDRFQEGARQHDDMALLIVKMADAD